MSNNNSNSVTVGNIRGLLPSDCIIYIEDAEGKSLDFLDDINRRSRYDDFSVGSMYPNEFALSGFYGNRVGIVIQI